MLARADRGEPAADDLRHVRGLVQRQAHEGRGDRAMMAFTSIAVEMSVNGMPIVRFGYSAAMLNQKISCTSTGVPRKKVM